MPRPPRIPVRRPPVVKSATTQSPEVAKLLQEGLALHRQGRLNDARQIYEKILQKQTNHFDALQLLATIYTQVKQHEVSLQYFDKALQINKSNAAVFNNRGTALKELKRLDDALKSYDEALRIKPDYADATWNKSLLLILTENYIDGWMLYEARLEKDDTKKNYPSYPQLVWRGQENIQGKKILIHSEQGLGDTIQFVRYLEQVHQLGSEIILEVPKTLSKLISTIKTPITVVDKGGNLPEFDAYCPLLSLPYVFKTTVETIPSSVPYLFADKQKVNEWESRLGQKTRKRIGLVWSGSTGHKNDHNRSIQLEVFDELLKLPFEWHSLQKEYRTEDKKCLDSHPEVKQHQDELDDFTDTAALIECMDLVISVDTSVAHLAGALGKSTWILLPFIPDYRWMLDREDCPWYPTAELLRQDESRDWNKVIASLVSRLKSIN